VPEGKTTVGLIGCGAWGRHILRDLGDLGCEVTVVARSEATAARAGQGGAHQVVRTIDELPDVEGVVVATPTVTHAAVVDALLDRSVPIFVEKPLVIDLADAERIVDRASDRVFVMDKWRYHPGVEQMADIARSGEFGRVSGVRTQRLGWGNPHIDVDGAARAAVAERVGTVVGGLTGVLGDDPWAVVEVSTSRAVRLRSVALHCEDAVVVLPDGYSDRLEIYRQSDPADTRVPPPELSEISTEMPLLRELRVFVEHLRGGPPPRSSAREAAEMVARIVELRHLAGVGA